METIILHVYYHCKPGMAEPFVKALKESGLQRTVQQEDGNNQYDYFLSMEEADTVVLLENWRDKAALEAHIAQPHMKEIGKVKENYVLSTELQRFEF